LRTSRAKQPARSVLTFGKNKNMKDEDFYGIAARELATRNHSEALMAKAYALALGDPEKTKSLYIGLRADQLKIEAGRIIVATIVEAKRQQDDAVIKQKEEAELKERRRKIAEQKSIQEAKELDRIRKEQKKKKDEDDAKRAASMWNNSDGWNSNWDYNSKSNVPELKNENGNIGSDGISLPDPSITLEESIELMKKAKDAMNRKLF
jgi:hypothetical protein